MVFNDFEAIAKRIDHVTMARAVDPMNVRCDRHLILAKSLEQRIVFRAAQCGVRLACGTKIGIDAEMQFDGTAVQPETAPARKMLGLPNFFKPHDADVERPRVRFATGRQCELYVVDS